MNITREQLKLYAVTDRTWLGNETLYEQVEKALKGGVTLVQLREKETSPYEFLPYGLVFAQQLPARQCCAVRCVSRTLPLPSGL